MAPYMGQLLSDSSAGQIGGMLLVCLNLLPTRYQSKKYVPSSSFSTLLDPLRTVLPNAWGRQAELDGLIKPGNTPIEASGGSTDIAIALMAAIKGYKSIIALSGRCYLRMNEFDGPGCRRCEDARCVSFESPDSTFSVARHLKGETSNSWILEQYNNTENSHAHEYGTEEISDQTEGDGLIAGAETGVAVTALARGLKKNGRNVFAVGVDPIRWILAHPEELNEEQGEYKVEGIGYDFFAGDLDRIALDASVEAAKKTRSGSREDLSRDTPRWIVGRSLCRFNPILEEASQGQCGKLLKDVLLMFGGDVLQSTVVLSLQMGSLDVTGHVPCDQILNRRIINQVKWECDK